MTFAAHATVMMNMMDAMMYMQDSMCMLCDAKIRDLSAAF